MKKNFYIVTPLDSDEKFVYGTTSDLNMTFCHSPNPSISPTEYEVVKKITQIPEGINSEKIVCEWMDIESISSLSYYSR